MTVGYCAKLEGAYCLQASYDFKFWLLGSPLATPWLFQGPGFNFLALKKKKKEKALVTKFYRTLTIQELETLLPKCASRIVVDLAVFQDPETEPLYEI